MIKVAVTGADNPVAGELIRILVNHPEVELTVLSAPGKEGFPVSSVHHGLIGKENLKFSGPLRTSPDCSVVFVCGNSMSAAEFSAHRLASPDLKIIQIQAIEGLDMEENDVVFGLPEINRKALVRGAMSSFIPSPTTVAALVPLYPMARNMLLNDTLNIRVSLPEDIIEKDKRTANAEIEEALKLAQLSFTKNIDVEYKGNKSSRCLEMQIEMDCSVPLEQIMEIYGIYDDHHNACPVLFHFSEKETAGRAVCVFQVLKNDAGKLIVRSSLDPRLRGGASEAVHNMNLMFGLHETTGLELKSSEF